MVSMMDDYEEQYAGSGWPEAPKKGIKFTQYLMPRGQKQDIWIDLGPEYQEKADRIIEAGLRFEVEMLSDYRTISMTIVGHHPEAGEELDLAIALCPNGPDVPETVKKIIDGFDLEAYKIRNSWWINVRAGCLIIDTR